MVPAVTPGSSNLSDTASQVTINGFGFDPTAAKNTVTFTGLGAVGSVTAATTTSLTVTFSTRPTPGNLTAIVTTDGVASAAVQVARTISAEQAYLVDVSGDNGTSSAGVASSNGNKADGDLRYVLNQAFLNAASGAEATITFNAATFTSAVLDTITLSKGLSTQPPGFANPFGPTAFIIGAADTVTINGSLGGGSDITLNAGGSMRLFVVDGGGALVLDNLTLSGGSAKGGNGGSADGGTNSGPQGGGGGGGGAGLGGAVLVDGSTFTANGCTFTNNLALGGKGGNGADLSPEISGDGAGAGGGGLGSSAAGQNTSAFMDPASGGRGGGGGGSGSTGRGGAGGPGLARGFPGGIGLAGGLGGGGGGAGGFLPTHYIGSDAIALAGRGGLGGGGGGGGSFSSRTMNGKNVVGFTRLDRSAGIRGSIGGVSHYMTPVSTYLGRTRAFNADKGTFTGSGPQGFLGFGGTGGYGAGSRQGGGGGGGGGSGLGGAIFSLGGTLTLSDDTLSQNTAEGGVGGFADTIPWVSVVQFYGMAGRDGRGFGGAVFTDGGTLTATSDTFRNNDVTNPSSATAVHGIGSDLFVGTDTATITHNIFASPNNDSVVGGWAAGSDNLVVGGADLTGTTTPVLTASTCAPRS